MLQAIERGDTYKVGERWRDKRKNYIVYKSRIPQIKVFFESLFASCLPEQYFAQWLSSFE
jgi:hypothetical protein